MEVTRLSQSYIDENYIKQVEEEGLHSESFNNINQLIQKTKTELESQKSNRKQLKYVSPPRDSDKKKGIGFFNFLKKKIRSSKKEPKNNTSSGKKAWANQSQEAANEIFYSPTLLSYR